MLAVILNTIFSINFRLQKIARAEWKFGKMSTIGSQHFECKVNSTYRTFTVMSRTQALRSMKLCDLQTLGGGEAGGGAGEAVGGWK